MSMTLLGCRDLRPLRRSRLCSWIAVALLSVLTPWPVHAGDGARGQAGEGQAGASEGSFPAIETAPLPSDSAEITRLAFGSCLHQARPQPIWKAILAAKPDLMLMMGDNVYGDFNDPSGERLAAAYAAQAARDEFREARTNVPMLAIWDDHDYGMNDGGADFEHRTKAAEIFHRFWGTAAERDPAEGIYYSRWFGPESRRLQLIFLDTRSARGRLKPKSAAFPHWGKYEPDADPALTMLGAAQWSWLQAELAKPADLRILVSSIQVLAEGHGWERWGNMPAERDRLLRLIAGVKQGRIVILSGDRHVGALYAQGSGVGEIVEATSSSLNMSFPKPAQDAALPPLVSDIVGQENFGMLAIDWERRLTTVELRGVDGAVLAHRGIRF